MYNSCVQDVLLNFISKLMTLFLNGQCECNFCLFEKSNVIPVIAVKCYSGLICQNITQPELFLNGFAKGFYFKLWCRPRRTQHTCTASFSGEKYRVSS